MRATTRVATMAAFVLTAAAALPLRAQDTVKVERPTGELITRAQIEEVKASNAHQVIEQLHSNWLVSRIPSPGNRATSKVDTSKASYVTDVQASGRSNPGENGGIQVYLDGSRLGGIDELKSLRPADIYNIRRINGVDAQARFGIGHGAGVIYVSTIGNRGTP
ncbi:MAG: hypothetical protein ABIY52_09220 [Gemmatimonadaceae bacterium]